jgi:sugar/nucleoside kinase (ribokinase family)
MSARPESDPPRGVFAGLATLDVAYRVEALPAPNEKITALTQELAAGGPAANAAVTFAALGGRATLVTALGGHPLARHAAAELADRGVEVFDATPDGRQQPAVSSIYVVDATGERSVVSVNGSGATPTPPAGLATLIAGAGVLVIDGHHPALALAAARIARANGVPVVLDGGSWKPVLDDLLPLVDVAVCSADFRAPGTVTVKASAAALRERGVPAVAVTRGGEPVLWWSAEPAASVGSAGSAGLVESAGSAALAGSAGLVESAWSAALAGSAGAVAVPRVRVYDTLGAGDVFHGAFGYAMSESRDIGLPGALAFAAAVATVRCSVPGLRAWLDTGALAAHINSLAAPVKEPS